MNKKNWITTTSLNSVVSFIKKYNLKKDVKSLTLTITAMGWINIYVNETRIDKTAFTPGWTNYLHRVQYMAYDIKDVVKGNCIDLKVDLANGWANAERLGTGGDKKEEPVYFPKSLNYEIEVTYLDGQKEIFESDENVEVFTNEVTFSDLYDGETQDSFTKIEKVGNAKYISIDSELIPQEGEDIVFAERIEAKEMFLDTQGNTVIDFGQNFAGNVEINIDGNDGDVISFTPAEVLDENGVFYNGNYRSAKSIYTFTISKNVKKYIAKFSFLGGRYIKLIKVPSYVKKENFTAVLIHSDMKKTCFFECGDKDLQRLYLNNIYGQLSNYIDVPTDCPQRDERLGWTADTQVFSSTAAINYDVKKFLTKWCRDLALDQGPNGEIYGICPKTRTCTWGAVSTGWGDAATIVPNNLYDAYGDVSILEENVGMMEKWVNYELSKCKKPFIVSLDFAFADWCALDKGYGWDSQGLTRFDLVDTAYTAYSVELLIKALKTLNKDTTKYEDILNKIKKAYQDEFIKDGHMVGPRALIFSKEERTANTQTGAVLTLQFDLCKKEDRATILSDLVENIKDCGTRLTTGFLGTPFLLHVLSDNGRADVAYDLLFQKQYPSWLYSVSKGATTFWEHYNGVKEDNTLFEPGMNSYNHYAYGSVFNWMFTNISGVKIVEPGYKKIKIEPRIDRRVGYVVSKFDSANGQIISNWKYKEDNKVEFYVSIPKGIIADIIFPDGKRFDNVTDQIINYVM